ncbi:hypothetical protein JCM8097_004987 [Rhodosporidiobolus ruineniae]
MPAPKLKGARKATQYRAKKIDESVGRDFDRKRSRLAGDEARMQTYEDVMALGGDEDHFHLNRDKMLLDSLGGTTQGYGESDDDALSDPDEIYSLSLPSGGRSPSPAAEDDASLSKERKKREFKQKTKEDTTTKGRFGHTYDPKQDVVYPSSDDDDESGSEDEGAAAAGPAKDQLADMAGSDAEEDKAAGSDDDSLAGDDRWAAAQYHATRRAPGEADSEDEEAAELELEEAKRLQRKARERLAGADFGVEEDEDEEVEDLLKKGGKRGRIEEDGDEEGEQAAEDEEEKTASGATASSLSEAEAIAHLLRTQPETLALVDDFVLTASKIKQVEADLEVVRQGDGKGGEHPALAIMELEHQALSTYLPTLAFYFSLLLTPLASRTPSHPQLVESVLARLSSLRQSLATMEELDLTSASYGAVEGSDEEEEDEDEEVEKRPKKGGRSMLASEALDFANALAEDDSDLDDLEDDDEEEGEEITESMLAGLDDAEVEELVGSLAPGEGAEELMARVRERQRAKGIEIEGSDKGAEEFDYEAMLREEEDDDDLLDAPAPAAKAKKVKAKKPQGIVIPELAPSSSKSSSKKASASKPSSSSAASDYLDPLALSLTDQADKSSNRHSLRFHVSQVAQKAAKREKRGRMGMEGDEDAPRRSKEAARRAVLQRQQHGASGESSRLDEGEFDEEDLRAARAVRGDAGGAGRDEEGGGGDAEDYYDLVAAEKDEGRRAKKAKYDEGRAQERAEIAAYADSSVDGPRGATRQILANKGLTPKRKKENRNARVKKRLRYDKAQKKLGSMQAQYKGGEARTGYEGETGGIARRNVKSRKLG